jgi:anti-anti-sigma factor
MPDSAATRVERHANAIVVKIQSDRLDETNIGAVRSDVSNAGAESPSVPVVLDLGGVTFMPSLSLGGLIGLCQVFKARGQRLVLVNMEPPVRNILAITRLDRLFEILDDASTLIGKP